MSEQGWRDFLGADGVEDWVVLHGGAAAMFRVGSVLEAARLAEGRRSPDVRVLLERIQLKQTGLYEAGGVAHLECRVVR